jgi:hypothetical protein
MFIKFILLYFILFLAINIYNLQKSVVHKQIEYQIT